MAVLVQFHPSDLVAVVWPRRSASGVEAGHLSWHDAAAGAWAMDPDRASRVRVLVAVVDDVVVGAWSVFGANYDTERPREGGRAVHRVTFMTGHDPRLNFLVGGPSPRPRRRNPQTTFELRELPGGAGLFSEPATGESGAVRVGAWLLVVHEDGRAEVHVPPGAQLVVRNAATEPSKSQESR